MLKWKFDKLLDRIEAKTGELDPIRTMAAEIGVGPTTVVELKKNRQVGLDMRVLDMILTWASIKLGEELAMSDIVEYTKTQTTWETPESWKEWDCGIYRRKR